MPWPLYIQVKTTWHPFKRGLSGLQKRDFTSGVNQTLRFGFQAWGLVRKLTELFSLSVPEESEVNHETCQNSCPGADIWKWKLRSIKWELRMTLICSVTLVYSKFSYCTPVNQWQFASFPCNLRVGDLWRRSLAYILNPWIKFQCRFFHAPFPFSCLYEIKDWINATYTRPLKRFGSHIMPYISDICIYNITISCSLNAAMNDMDTVCPNNVGESWAD